jgi:hypothetical protein
MCWLSSTAQVGVNTTHFSEGVIFEVTGDGGQGVILTTSNIPDLNFEAPLPEGIPDGTLTFNTNISTGIGYLWWNNAEHSWKFVDPFLGKKALFKNAVIDDVAGDLNQPEAAVFQVPILGTEIFNESPILYSVLNNGRELQVAADGRYRIMVSLGIESQDDLDTDNDYNIIECALSILSAGVSSYPSSFQHSSEMNDTNNNLDDDGSISFTEILELNANDIISLRTYSASLSGNNVVYMNRPSNFFIIKIN